MIKYYVCRFAPQGVQCSDCHRQAFYAHHVIDNRDSGFEFCLSCAKRYLKGVAVLAEFEMKHRVADGREEPVTEQWIRETYPG